MMRHRRYVKMNEGFPATVVVWAVLGWLGIASFILWALAGMWVLYGG